MAISLAPVPTRPTKRADTFRVVASDSALDPNLPQRMAQRLWIPMLVMGLMGLTVGLILAIVRADVVAGGQAADTLARLQHVQAGFTFIGFLGVFSAVVFAIARILAAFRTGGGLVQQTAGAEVQTLRMPATAKGMLAFMAMGMMAITAAVVLHFVVAGTVVGAAEADLVRSEQWFTALEGVRRLGVALYLLAIALGLGTIVTVLRFQAVRMRELVEPPTG